MNGHLQLGISLKDHQQIKDAIKLLESLLPSKLPDHPVEFYNVTPATEGDMVRLSTTKPKMLSNYKIVENLMRGAPKAPKHDRVYRDADGKVKVHKGRDRTMREKFRQNALKRKRDKSGHFLPTKK